MSFALTERAFRFDGDDGKQYALDIFNDGIVYSDGPAVHLLVSTPDGWNRCHVEMEPVMYVRPADIEAAGGNVKICQLIVAKVNRALRILFGKAGDTDIPASTEPYQQVMDLLRTSLKVTKTPDGVTQLSLS